MKKKNSYKKSNSWLDIRKFSNEFPKIDSMPKLPEDNLIKFKENLKKIIAFHDQGLISDSLFSTVLSLLCAKFVEFEIQDRMTEIFNKKIDTNHFLRYLEI